MNNDLISRSALLESLDKLYMAALRKTGSSVETIYELDHLAMLVKDAPTVDAEVVRHGYWIPQDNTRTKFMCSDCKSRNHDGSGKYCSECGCKMDGEHNDIQGV